MSVHASLVLRDMFGTEGMREIFSDAARTRKYLLIEVALAKVESELGIIPSTAYDEIKAGAATFEIDWERLRQDTHTIGTPVLPMLRQFTEVCGAAGAYLHWGSNTRDITDTAQVLQIGEALDLINTELSAIKVALADLASRHRATVTIGRTHGMHALPTTFGLRAAIWLAEVDRQIVRLDATRGLLKEGQFGGVVGTLAALGARGLDVQQALLQELGLRAPVVSWFASRDRIADVICTLSQIAGTMASIGRTIVSMARTEVAEASEPDVKGRGTSSSMPQKHNTVGSELAIVYSRTIAQMLPLVFDAMVQDYDRDYQGHYETIVVPEAFLLAHASLVQMRHVLEGLHVDPIRMRRNFELSHGTIMAESLMMALAPRIGRKNAHERVSEACVKAVRQGIELKTIVSGDPAFTTYLSAAEIEHALSPESYIGLADAIITNVLQASESGRR